MEAKLGGKLHHSYGHVVSDLNRLGRSSEWDLSDWRWDGDFLRAAPLSTVPSDCRSRQFFRVGSDIPAENGFMNFFSSVEDEREKRDSDKRRRYIEVIEEEDSEETGSLNLKLGGQAFPVVDTDTDKCEKSAKKSKSSGVQPSRAVCQVEDCKADLSNAKDYHRRHKVCDVHSKASRALVGSVMQRFCQQCSRFHALEEFDEGKRSCRRRLEGHNKRRRKTHPENTVSTAALDDEQSAKYLLNSLLRILSGAQTSSSEQTNDQDLLSHLLRNLATLAGSTNATSPIGSLPISQDIQNAGTSVGTLTKDMRHDGRDLNLPSTNLTQKHTLTDNAEAGPAFETSALCFPISADKPEATVGRVNMCNIDLNSVYDDSEDCTEEFLDNAPVDNLGSASPCAPWSFKDSQRSSPLQNSGNSGSSQSQSPSTSSGEALSHTDRIVFKLFGKNPSDLPLDLRKQMLDWLSNSPSDIESYIRPGCIILTIYVCMDKSNWDELYCNLHSSLRRLLDASSDPFWRTAWIYTRIEHRATFLCNGQIVLDMPIPLKVRQRCRISMVTPIAVSSSESVHFSVRGYNLSGSTSRLLCALEGSYLLQENCANFGGADSLTNNEEEIQHLEFSCAVPDVVGRGFVEVEDYCLNSSSFPFIVAENDVCSEICGLEPIIEVSDSAKLDTDSIEARNLALNFVHEMGWLLHKTHLILRLCGRREDVDLFPFRRFKNLIEFAVDHDWPAVVRKLLDVLFDGIVVADQDTSIVAALLDTGLLHHAVRKKSQTMVQFLLKYQPSGISTKTCDCHEGGSFLFRPDATGPGGLTPLHIAAGSDNCDAVLDSLTEDPESVGIGTWKNSRDSTGLTPHDYACMRGNYSYIHLVQRKLDKKPGQVVVDIPVIQLDDGISKQKMEDGQVGAFQMEKSMMMSCRNLGYRSSRASVALYRPAMLSMIAIAAVCVCAALIFKSSPHVIHPFRPFRWELLKYGAE